MQSESQLKINKIAKLVGIVIGIVMVLGVSYAVFRVKQQEKKRMLLVQEN